MTEKTMNAHNKSVKRGRATSLTDRVSYFGTACIATSVLLAFTPRALYALGTRIPNQDAESTAKGNAVIASADNPSAIYYNPAGITQIQDPEAQFGLHIISVNSHFEAEAGGSSNTKFEIQEAPQIYCVLPLQNAPLDHRISLGLGIYAPYGLDEVAQGILRPNPRNLRTDRFAEKAASYRARWPWLKVAGDAGDA